MGEIIHLNQSNTIHTDHGLDIRSEKDLIEITENILFDTHADLSQKIHFNALQNLGNVNKAVGKLIGSIPLVKEGPMDEFLQASGPQLEKLVVS